MISVIHYLSNSAPINIFLQERITFLTDFPPFPLLATAP